MGPTPQASGTLIYIEYLKQIADVALTSNLYYDESYDPVILALARTEFLYFFDMKDRATITTAEQKSDKLVHDLITAAAHNIGENRQTNSRRQEMLFGPRIPASVGNVGP